MFPNRLFGFVIPTAIERTGSPAPVQPPQELPPAPPAARTLADQVAKVERAAIAQALRDNGGNRAQTARQLGMSRAALYDRLARWPDLDHSS